MNFPFWWFPFRLILFSFPFLRFTIIIIIRSLSARLTNSYHDEPIDQKIRKAKQINENLCAPFSAIKKTQTYPHTQNTYTYRRYIRIIIKIKYNNLLEIIYPRQTDKTGLILRNSPFTQTKSWVLLCVLSLPVSVIWVCVVSSSLINTIGHSDQYQAHTSPNTHTHTHPSIFAHRLNWLILFGQKIMPTQFSYRVFFADFYFSCFRSIEKYRFLLFVVPIPGHHITVYRRENESTMGIGQWAMGDRTFFDSIKYEETKLSSIIIIINNNILLDFHFITFYFCYSNECWPKQRRGECNVKWPYRLFIPFPWA